MNSIFDIDATQLPKWDSHKYHMNMFQPPILQDKAVAAVVEVVEEVEVARRVLHIAARLVLRCSTCNHLDTYTWH